MIRTADLTLPELLERLNAGQIPANATVRVTYDDAAADAAKADPTLALFAQWAGEDTRITPEQQAENERVYSEIEQNGIPRVQI